MNVERTIQRIKALGITADLKVPRKLTIEEWNSMHPEVQSYHLEANGAAVAAMDELEANKAASAVKKADQGVDEYFATPDEAEQRRILKQGEQFAQRWRQFVVVEQNTQRIVDWILANRRARPTQSDFDEAMVTLTRNGELLIDLSKCNAGTGIITGWELKHHPLMHKILEPTTMTAAQKEKKAIDSMSSDEFRRSRPELADGRVPPILAAQFHKAVATLESMRPYDRTDENNKVLLDYIAKNQAGMPFSVSNLLAAFDATKHLLQLKSTVAEHGATRVVDYAPRKSTSELLDGSKLRKKVNSMSSAEYAVWCKDNPSAATALDALA
jgi:hypothetical protein